MNQKLSLKITQLNKECGIYAAFCVAVFAVLPLLYSPTIFDPTQNPHLIGGLCIVMLFCFSLLFIRLEKSYKCGIIDVAWVVYIVFALLSLFHSRDSSIALFELIKILFTYFLFVLFQINRDQKSAWISSAVAVSFVCLFQGAIVILQKNIGWDIYSSNSEFFGTMTHANVLAECIVFAFPLTVCGILLGTKATKTISTIGFVCSLFLIITLKTRAIWVSFAIAALIVLLLLIKNTKLQDINKWIAQYRRGVFVVAIILVMATITYVFHDIKDFSNHLRTLLILDSSGRTIIWTETIHFISEHFWFGVGLGNFRFYLPKTIGAFIQRPHNDYLWVLSEIGVWGLIGFLATFYISLKQLYTNIRTLTGEKLIITFCAFFGLIVYLVDSFFAFPKERPYNLVFLAFFLATPIASSSAKSFTNIKSKYFIPFIIIISTGCLWFCCLRFNGEKNLKTVFTDIKIQPEQRLVMLQKINPLIYKVDPVTMPVKYYEGMAWLSLNNIQQAKDCFQEAYKTYPFQPDVLLNLGTANEIMGSRELAKRFFKEAIRADYSDIRPKVNLAVIEYKEGNYQKSAEIINSIDTNSVKDAPESKVQFEILRNSLRNIVNNER